MSDMGCLEAKLEEEDIQYRGLKGGNWCCECFHIRFPPGLSPPPGLPPLLEISEV